MTSSLQNPASVQPTSNFIKLDELSSAAVDGLYEKDPTQYTKITKYSIQKFIENCLFEGGQFRPFFEKIATFTVGFEVNTNLSEDLQQRTIQIARLFSNVREQPPQIFIQDGGYEYIPSSLGGFSAGFSQNDSLGHQTMAVSEVVVVPIELTCAALDIDLCSELRAFLSAAFGQWQRWTANYYLRPAPNEPRVSWEVRIPLRHTMSRLSPRSLHGDGRDQIWECTCSMDVEFENTTYLQYRAKPLAEQQLGTLQLIVPDRIIVNRSETVNILNMPRQLRVFSDNSRVAVIETVQTSFIIRPKRPGKFNLVLELPSQSNDQRSATVKTKEIEVVLR
jgi:hypothetical protein